MMAVILDFHDVVNYNNSYYVIWVLINEGIVFSYLGLSTLMHESCGFITFDEFVLE